MTTAWVAFTPASRSLVFHMGCRPSRTFAVVSFLRRNCIVGVFTATTFAPISILGHSSCPSFKLNLFRQFAFLPALSTDVSAFKACRSAVSASNSRRLLKHQIQGLRYGVHSRGSCSSFRRCLIFLHTNSQLPWHLSCVAWLSVASKSVGDCQGQVLLSRHDFRLKTK